MAASTAANSGGDKWMALLSNLGAQQQQYSPANSSSPRMSPLFNDAGAQSLTNNVNKQVAANDTAAGFLGRIGGGFGQGFTLGYEGVNSILAPFLGFRKAKHERAIMAIEAKLADWNAKSYQTAAEDVVRAGHQRVASLTYQLGQMQSATRVGQAAAGIRVGGAGSAAEQLASNALVTQMQVNQVLANSVVESFGYRRAAVRAKCGALSIRAARAGINPWAAANTEAIMAASRALPKVQSAISSFKMMKK